MSTAVSVQGVSKRFRLYHERNQSLKAAVLRHGRASYEEFWALRDVSFEVEQGTTFGLVGHNGSGKSTLLKLLAGVYRPTSGSIVSTGRISALLELGAGFHGDLTGRENIHLNGAILGMSRKQIDAAMDEIIDFAGIGEFIDAPVKVYSSGMYVRLGFSIAVTVDPEILIVDEIIAVGDEEFQRKCFDHLYELRKRGTTIVLVSHAMGLVSDLCDRGVWLDHGTVQEVGEIRDVVDGYLDAVNSHESEDSAATVEEPVEPGRRGSGEIRVTGLDFLDADGAPTTFLSPGEPCTVRMHFHAKAALDDLVFGLGFVHESGVTAAGPNSGGGGRTISARPGDGVVEYALPRLPLQAGLFRVSTAIVDRGHVYDFVDRGYDLKVRASSSVDEPGLTRFFGTWSVTEAITTLQERRTG